MVPRLRPEEVIASEVARWSGKPCKNRPVPEPICPRTDSPKACKNRPVPEPIHRVSVVNPNPSRYSPTRRYPQTPTLHPFGCGYSRAVPPIQIPKLCDLCALYLCGESAPLRPPPFLRALLVQKDSETLELDLATTLDHVGGIDSKVNHLDNARNELTDSLQIRRQVALKNPERIRPT